MYKLFLFGVIMYCAPGFAFARAAPETTECADEVSVPNAPPKYPASEVRDGIGGRVILRVTIDACGRPTKILLDKSSDNINLDNAAFDAVRSWKFTGDAKATDVLVPVDFIPPVLLGPESFQSLPAVTRETGAGQYYGLGATKFYIPDERPLGLNEVNSAPALIDQYCLVEVKEIEPGFHRYVTYGITDYSEWWLFTEKHAVGPSVVRRRYFSIGDRGYLKTAHLCESKNEGACELLKAVLESRPEQEILPPPPIPRRLPGAVGKEKETIVCD